MRLALVLVLAACSDYNLNPDADPALPGDTAPEPEETGLWLPPEELCNGRDDDHDGLVDEDFRDVDGDGLADCIDPWCPTEPAAPRSESDEACEGGVTTGPPPVDPWSWTIEWQWLGGAVVSTPSVGDLDADGVPEIVTAISTNELVVLDGATGRVEWKKSGFDGLSGSALADIDGDGRGEIIATSAGGCYGPHDVIALEDDGTQIWRTVIGNACETYPAIHDLDGDGTLEVLVNDYVLDAATGRVEATLSGMASDNWGAVAAADLDLDGTMEILLSNGVFDPSGRRLWTCGVGGVGAFPQPANVDADPAGELLVAGNGSMTLCDDDGTVLWRRTYGSYGAPIAVADFDDDGLQEFAFAKSSTMTLIDGDGRDLWATAITDFSGLAGATSWDVDMDGVPEVVYADEDAIMVLDGASGAIVIREPAHGSWTAAETPAVADVDGDGHGELVYGSNSGITGITVVGSKAGDWPYSKPVYNQYTYYGGNVEDDLTVPSVVEPPWIYEANLFRGQPSAIYVAGSPNLHAAVTDLCVASCEPGGYAAASLQVWNDGKRGVTGALVRTYGTTTSGLSLIDERRVDVDAEASVEFELTTTWEAVGAELYVVVDEVGEVEECNEDDNHGTWTEVPDCTSE